jgi:ABC-type bacteriocin/lantibiotic exporter with double-glycine peptidase domain
MKQLDFPELKQTNEYDCGAKALQAVLTYYGIEIREEILIKSAKTNKKTGTTIKGILDSLKKYKLKFDSKSMDLKELRNYLDKKIPVMLLIQAWNKKSIDYTKDFHDGHWVVAIGYNRDKIFFEDPYTFNRTFLKNKEFEKRWHSKEKSKKIVNYGIAVYGKKPTYDSKKVVKMK